MAAAEGRIAQRGQLALLPTETFEAAVTAYCAHKAGRWEEQTRKSYAADIPVALARPFPFEGRQFTLGALRVTELAGDRGSEIWRAWADAEIARAGGRTHTAIKRIANWWKPALTYVERKGWLAGARLPIWPALSNDYKSHGAPRVFFSRAQYAALVGELLERDAILRKGGGVCVVYPRLAAEIDVGTGLHEWDLHRFSVADWDRERGLWYRRNSKGAAHYPPRWFPCDPILTAALERHAGRFAPHPCDPGIAGWVRPPKDTPRCPSCGLRAALWVAEGEVPPRQFMAMRLKWAAKRAGLPFRPSMLAFRRTFATWKRDAGWRKEEVAEVLGNSSDMVEEIYAQIADERFVQANQRSAGDARAISDMLAFAGPRRGPRIRRDHHLPSVTALVPAVVKRSGGEV